MKARLQQWKERYDALTLRERGFVMLGVLALIHSLWNFGPMRVIHKNQKAVLGQIQQSQKELSDIDKKIQMISDAFAPGDESSAMQRINSLKTEIQRINQVKKNVTVGFIRPHQMAEVLKGLLGKEPGLKLLSFQTLDVESLFDNGKSASARKTAAQNNSEQADVQAQSPNYPQVYKHGVVIEFQGDYKSTVEYLRSLESLPWKFYWDGLAYNVEDYPKAVITINVFTLSLEKGWIGV